MGTQRVGMFTITEHNMVCPDGKKVWVVKDHYGNIVYHSMSKRDAVAWSIRRA